MDRCTCGDNLDVVAYGRDHQQFGVDRAWAVMRGDDEGLALLNEQLTVS
jgi:hypothetical protein